MKLKITVHGVAYEVDVEVLDPGDGFPPALPVPARPHRPPAPNEPAPSARRRDAGEPPRATSAEAVRSVASPVAGTVLEVRCKAGEEVAENRILFVLEAMKMKTSIAAPARGRVAQVLVAPGDGVEEGQALLHYE